MQMSVMGINGGRVVQDVAAGNIANSMSENYQAARVELSSGATGGVRASISVSEEKPLTMYNSDGSQTTFSNVDMVSEIMNVKMGGLMVEANAAAFKIQEQSLGTVIDAMG
jgi:flagellar basal body rod protein FlgB